MIMFSNNVEMIDTKPKQHSSIRIFHYGVKLTRPFD